MQDYNNLLEEYKNTMKTNSNLAVQPPNFATNNKQSNTIIKKNEDLPTILDNKYLQDREPLLEGYKDAPINFKYEEEKTDPLFKSPLFIILTLLCMSIYGMIFYIISIKN